MKNLLVGFNCGFFSRSLLVKVTVEGDFDYENDNFDEFIYTADLSSVRVINLKD